jgi:hypothetical protein
MIRKIGGTRAILAFLLVLAFIGACFVPQVSGDKFLALGTMTTTAITFYFANKATKDKPAE